MDKPKLISKNSSPQKEVKLQEMKNNNSDSPHSQDVVLITSLDKEKLASDGNLNRNTPSKELSKVRKEVCSVSSQGDLYSPVPKSPAVSQTPPHRNGSISSPVQPSAPPNTPINGNHCITPPSIPLAKISALCSLPSYKAFLSMSPSDKSSGDEGSWKPPDHALTPYNTANILNVNSPTHSHTGPSSPCFDFGKVSPSCNTSLHSCDFDHLSPHARDLLITGYRKQIVNSSPPVVDSSHSKRHSPRKCPSCGKRLNETYVIDKHEFASPVMCLNYD